MPLFGKNDAGWLQGKRIRHFWGYSRRIIWAVQPEFRRYTAQMVAQPILFYDSYLLSLMRLPVCRKKCAKFCLKFCTEGRQPPKILLMRLLWIAGK